MDSIKQTSPSLRQSAPTLEKLEDMPERNSTSGVFRAGDSDPEKVEIDKVFKTNDDGIVGDQPNDPISPLESERFFLSELMFFWTFNKGSGHLSPVVSITTEYFFWLFINNLHNTI